MWITLIMLWLHSLELSLQFHRTIYKHICLLLHTATVPSPVFYHLTSHHTFSQLSLYCTKILCYPIGLSAWLHSSHRLVGSSNHPSFNTRNFIHHCQGVISQLLQLIPAFHDFAKLYFCVEEQSSSKTTSIIQLSFFFICAEFLQHQGHQKLKRYVKQQRRLW